MQHNVYTTYSLCTLQLFFTSRCTCTWRWKIDRKVKSDTTHGHELPKPKSHKASHSPVDRSPMNDNPKVAPTPEHQCSPGDSQVINANAIAKRLDAECLAIRFPPTHNPKRHCLYPLRRPIRLLPTHDPKCLLAIRLPPIRDPKCLAAEKGLATSRGRLPPTRKPKCLAAEFLAIRRSFAAKEGIASDRDGWGCICEY